MPVQYKNILKTDLTLFWGMIKTNKTKSDLITRKDNLCKQLSTTLSNNEIKEFGSYLEALKETLFKAVYNNIPNMTPEQLYNWCYTIILDGKQTYNDMITKPQEVYQGLTQDLKNTIYTTPNMIMQEAVTLKMIG